ncbi:MFS transporter [Tsukamurella sp. NPDC003166]|uniref:MFS transporter n=1 Tax=Tsukamurella sp. NPDC003166 TaxID=3154444 RepID=UPI0033A0A4EE
MGLLSFNFPVILPVFAEKTFHGTGGTYSLMSAVLSAGSVLGSLAVGKVPHPRRQYLVVTSLAFGIALGATALAPTVPIACVLLVAAGAAGFSFVTLASVALQLHAAPEFRGRVMALWVFVFIGTTPIGSVVMGWITQGWGPRGALWVGAVAAIVAAGGAFLIRTPIRTDDELETRFR